MALLTAKVASRSGVDLSPVAANAGGDEFVNNGRELLYIKNASGSSITLTVQTPVTVDGLAVSDRQITVGAGEEKIIGPFPKGTYNDGNGHVQLSYSAVTSVTVSVIDPGS
ncbi:MAG: hypothetical protein KatS3mg105_3297 [Gemmatales bacterium]|nr:MAG: hypothetical protein KatS3mg105_3297 [Gemmatales bacterium]